MDKISFYSHKKGILDILEFIIIHNKNVTLNSLKYNSQDYILRVHLISSIQNEELVLDNRDLLCCHNKKFYVEKYESKESPTQKDVYGSTGKLGS